MKYYAIPLAASLVFAQQTTTHTYDVNGRRTPAVSLTENLAPGAFEKRQTVQNLNGRRVPVDEVEERVVSDDGRTRVVERVTRRYDANGRPGAPEKTRIETRKNADGSTVATTLTMRGDLNGNLRVEERSVTETRQSGNATTASTLVERPALNGGMQLYEKREEVKLARGADEFTQTTTTLRPDTNGRMSETARSTLEVSKQNGATVENAAVYELGTLVRQTVARTVTVNGAEQSVVDVFTAEAAGKVRAASESRPQLKERQLVERRKTGAGVVESVSVQRPSPSDPQRLGNPQQVEETICTGKCTL